MLGLARLSMDERLRRRFARLAALCTVFTAGAAIANIWFLNRDIDRYTAFFHDLGSYWTAPEIGLHLTVFLISTAIVAGVHWLSVTHRFYCPIRAATLWLICFGIQILQIVSGTMQTIQPEQIRSAQHVLHGITISPQHRILVFKTSTRGSGYQMDPMRQDTIDYYRKLAMNTPGVFKIRTLGGFSPVMSPDHERLKTAAGMELSSMLDAMSVRYLVVSTDSVDLEADDRILRAFPELNCVVIENKGALPRLSIEKIAGGEQSVTIVSEDTSQLTADCEGPGLLVIRNWYHAGYRAEVNGIATDVEPYGARFMALNLPAGNSRVVLRYVPPGLKLGSYIALAVLVALLIFVGISRHKQVKSC
jgi:hypothetical protein